VAVARSSGSRFVVRVEDLDRAASRPELVRSQLADLRALGIDWDGDVVHLTTLSVRSDCRMGGFVAS
jgi:glutamyl/glutaminyl-tRNA synthetase